ncbi:uncharacterized protein LOC126576481 [Anopheles aquasalis]|uniref:uncharacterized protein LOC126576481 n=1 Tax=Anopheles aquasalis TaxID=42839 RepID=UPI00215B2914|nr:uncharacterized protein LOC126576481 [Anopheles aquasalis]
MKCASIFLLVAGLLVVSTTTDGRPADGHRLLDTLQRVRRQQGPVNYGFPTFPPAWGNAQGFGQSSLFSRGDFDAMPDIPQIKQGHTWASRSCVIDKNGKQKCVEKHGDKP